MSIQELENLRIKIVSTKRTCYFITFVISVLNVFILWSSINGDQSGTGIFFQLPIVGFIITWVIGFIVASILTSGDYKKFMDHYKKAFVEKSLESIFTDLEYEPYKGLDSEILRQTGMIYLGDRYHSEDLVKGKYKNISVEQADVHIEEEVETTDSDGNTSTYWETLFLGRWLIFDFNKTFKANLQVRQNGFYNSVLRRQNGLSYSKVSMEDMGFNKKFTVYAQDEHEAFYILTPQLMEKIMSVCNKLEGHLLLCFVDNKLHVGLDNRKDSFEYNINKPINEKEILDSISKDIKIITDFVDDLSLDNSLFRKEV